jgi:hypothetical protein
LRGDGEDGGFQAREGAYQATLIFSVTLGLGLGIQLFNLEPKEVTGLHLGGSGRPYLLLPIIPPKKNNSGRDTGGLYRAEQHIG